MALDGMRDFFSDPSPLAFSSFVLKAMEYAKSCPPHSHAWDAHVDCWRKGMMERLQSSLHVTADSRDSNWSFGTFAWVLLATLRSRCSSPAQVFPERLRRLVACTRAPVPTMTLHEVFVSLHGLSMRWKGLNREFGSPILQRAVLALEHRASDILVSEALPANVVQHLANLFVFFMRFFQYRNLFPLLKTGAVGPTGAYDAVYEKYIDARRFRKKLLGTYFILSPRISDMALGFEDYSAETLLQSGRSEKWNQMAQTQAYNETLLELLKNVEFADAVRLNAFDLWFKHTFNVGFKEHFLILQKDVVRNYKKISTSSLPLLAYGNDGISVFYGGRLSKTMQCTHAFQLWFEIIERDHEGAVFNNILVHAPAEV